MSVEQRAPKDMLNFYSQVPVNVYLEIVFPDVIKLSIDIRIGSKSND